MPNENKRKSDLYKIAAKKAEAKIKGMKKSGKYVFEDASAKEYALAKEEFLKNFPSKSDLGVSEGAMAASVYADKKSAERARAQKKIRNRKAGKKN